MIVDVLSFLFCSKSLRMSAWLEWNNNVHENANNNKKKTAFSAEWNDSDVVVAAAVVTIYDKNTYSMFMILHL